MAAVSSHLYVGVVALAIRMHSAMPCDLRAEFDERQGGPMDRLAADFNAQEFSLEMAPNGSGWMLRDREPADSTKDPER